MTIPYQSIKSILLYFPSDKTFDIRNVSDTSFSEVSYDELVSGRMVKIAAEYDCVSTRGVIVQVAELQQHLRPFMEECVFLKTKGFSLERIFSLSYIPRFNKGARPRIPNRKV
jgi:hypothetical protein